jgi:hypothetical protein
MHNIDKWMNFIHLVWIASVYTVHSSMLWCTLRLYFNFEIWWISSSNGRSTSLLWPIFRFSLYESALPPTTPPPCKCTWFVLHGFQRICLRVILSACLCFWLFPDRNKKKKKEKLWWWVGEKRRIFFFKFQEEGFCSAAWSSRGKESGAWTRVGYRCLFGRKEVWERGMTTAARPTWAPAKGGHEQGGVRMFGPSQKFSSRDLASHTNLKLRFCFSTPYFPSLASSLMSVPCVHLLCITGRQGDAACVLMCPQMLLPAFWIFNNCWRVTKAPPQPWNNILRWTESHHICMT